MLQQCGIFRRSSQAENLLYDGVARKPKTCYKKDGVARKPKTCYKKDGVARKPKTCYKKSDESRPKTYQRRSYSAGCVYHGHRY